MSTYTQPCRGVQRVVVWCVLLECFFKDELAKSSEIVGNTAFTCLMRAGDGGLSGTFGSNLAISAVTFNNFSNARFTSLSHSCKVSCVSQPTQSFIHHSTNQSIEGTTALFVHPP